MKAVTTVVISGACIPTIPVGTEFEVVTIVDNYGYATCRGLPISTIWLDEFKTLKEKCDE